MTPTQEQSKRVERWLNRFEEIRTRRQHTRDTEYYQDTVYAFFQNFWHLRDWIINSKALDKNIVDNFFFAQNDTDMKLCRDLANGSKHLVLNNPSLPSKPEISSSVFSLSSVGGQPEINIVYWINTENLPPVEAFQLAQALMAKCKGFLLEHNLITKTE